MTVLELVRLFELRRRAATDEFSAGVDLAMSGAVHFFAIADERVTACVDASTPLEVELVAATDTIVGRCTCGRTSKPCRHEVAVAHALWVRDWGQPPYGESVLSR